VQVNNSLHKQRVYAETEGQGAPGGSCVNEMGYLWNAEWGGNRVVHYRPDGTTDAILTSTGIQSTCPTLAGEGFASFYCATAFVGLTALSEYDGALLKAESDVSPGLPENRFAANIV
jgi:L-arabinonolactonase